MYTMQAVCHGSLEKESQHFFIGTSVDAFIEEVALELHIKNVCSCNKQKDKEVGGKGLSDMGKSLNKNLEGRKQDILNRKKSKHDLLSTCGRC